MDEDNTIVATSDRDVWLGLRGSRVLFWRILGGAVIMSRPDAAEAHVDAARAALKIIESTSTRLAVLQDEMQTPAVAQSVRGACCWS